MCFQITTEQDTGFMEKPAKVYFMNNKAQGDARWMSHSCSFLGLADKPDLSLAPLEGGINFTEPDCSLVLRPEKLIYLSFKPGSIITQFFRLI